MTVIAWDGERLAADRLADSNGLARSVTKIRLLRGHLCGASGRTAYCQAMFAWFEGGAEPGAYPRWQDSDDYADFVAITPDRRILKWERTPHPIEYEDQHFAMGSGRDYAMAAMHLGKTAVEAVEVASHFEIGCGNGIDVLEISEGGA